MIKSPGTGVTGSCEPPDTGAGSQTPNLSALVPVSPPVPRCFFFFFEIGSYLVGLAVLNLLCKSG